MNTRNETDRDAIATLIQVGHIEHKTSDEIAFDVLAYVNTMLQDRSGAGPHGELLSEMN